MPKITITRTPDLKKQMLNFEERYGMTSEKFLERWVNGELDGHDYVLWAGLCQLAGRSGLLPAPVLSKASRPTPSVA